MKERHLQDFVFIHINKTGGTSIERALGLPLQHKTAQEKRAELGKAAWTTKKVFTVVRNPWDKVVSHYHHRVQTGQTGLGPGEIGFGEWVTLTYRDQEPRYYDNPRMFMPQINWRSDVDGTLMVDYVGRFERLEQDFGQICELLGRKASLPHLKKSSRGAYRRYYDH